MLPQLTIKSLIRAAFEAIPGGLLTAFPNRKFNPPALSVAWQKFNVVFARPEEQTAGTGFYREIGFLQATLFYPIGEDEGAALERAELVRNSFPKGSSLAKDGITVHFNNVGQIMEGPPTDENYVVIVRVPFYADVYT